MHNHTLFIVPRENINIYLKNSLPKLILDIEIFRKYVEKHNTLSWIEIHDLYIQALIKDDTLPKDLRGTAVYKYDVSIQKAIMDISFVKSATELMLQFDYLDEEIIAIIMEVYSLYPNMVFVDPDVPNEPNKETYEIYNLEEFINIKSKLSKYRKKKIREKEVMTVKRKSFWEKLFKK